MFWTQRYLHIHTSRSIACTAVRATKMASLRTLNIFSRRFFPKLSTTPNTCCSPCNIGFKNLKAPVPLRSSPSFYHQMRLDNFRVEQIGEQEIKPHTQWRSFAVSSRASQEEQELKDDVENDYIHSVFDVESVLYPSWERHASIKIEEASRSSTVDKAIDIKWHSGSDSAMTKTSRATKASHVNVTTFPFAWLRDNCRCPQCFSSKSGARRLRVIDMDVEGEVQSIAIHEDSKVMRIVWDDGHVSDFPARWLRCNNFADSDPDPVIDLEPEFWDAATIAQRLRFFDFTEILNDDDVLYEMLIDLKTIGLTIVKNAPLERGQVHRLADSIGYLSPCSYGTDFQVMSKEKPSSGAYTSENFGLHTDLCFCYKSASIQMLHCIHQADEGGENALADSFKAADELRRSSPKLFDLLTKTPLEYMDVGIDAVGDFYHTARHPVIRLDERGRFEKVVYGDHVRSAVSRVAVDRVNDLYRGLKAFAQHLYNPANVFEHRLEDGQIVLMDNYRVLHGRKEFHVRPGGPARHLEGGYLDWDSVYSKLRVLQRSRSKSD